jgi:hypothetical protein
MRVEKERVQQIEVNRLADIERVKFEKESKRRLLEAKIAQLKSRKEELEVYNIYVHVYIYLFMYAFVYILVYIFMYIFMYIFIYIYIFIGRRKRGRGAKSKSIT